MMPLKSSQIIIPLERVGLSFIREQIWESQYAYTNRPLFTIGVFNYLGVHCRFEREFLSWMCGYLF